MTGSFHDGNNTAGIDEYKYPIVEKYNRGLYSKVKKSVSQVLKVGSK